MVDQSKEPLKICIAIPTIGKSPYLASLLNDLENQVRKTNLLSFREIKLVVIDNRPTHVTKQIVQKNGAFSYIEEFERGYVAARNRILEESQGNDFLVMIDDDMRLSEKWLDGVLNSIHSSEAEIYSSDVFPDNVWSIPSSLRGFFVRPSRAVGVTIPNFGSGNVILDLNFIKKHSISFDPKFNDHGGEDIDFFFRMSSYGARAKWNFDFPVYENHISSQLTFAAISSREVRNAKNYERYKSNHSFVYKLYLIAHFIEIVFFDWASIKLAVSSTEKFTTKIRIYLHHKTISIFKIFSRLAVVFQRH